MYIGEYDDGQWPLSAERLVKRRRESSRVCVIHC